MAVVVESGGPKRGPIDLFLSWTREDRERAWECVRELVERNYTVWIDEFQQRTPAESAWRHETEDALARSSAAVLFLSPASAQSAYMLENIGCALDMSKPMLPVLLVDGPFELEKGRAQLPPGFATAADEVRQAIWRTEWAALPPPPGSAFLAGLHAVLDFIEDGMLRSQDAEADAGAPPARARTPPPPALQPRPELRPLFVDPEAAARAHSESRQELVAARDAAARMRREAGGREDGAPAGWGSLRDEVLDAALDGRLFGSIGEAVRAARPGALIRLRPGRYDEALVVDKAVAIEGEGATVGPRRPAGPAALFCAPPALFLGEGGAAPRRRGAAAEAAAEEAVATVRGVTFLAPPEPAPRNVHPPKGARPTRHPCVWIRSGAAVLEGCTVQGSSGAAACVRITGLGTRATLTSCTIAGGADVGVYVAARGASEEPIVIEDCTLQRHAKAGVYVECCSAVEGDVPLHAQKPVIMRDCDVQLGAGVGVHVLGSLYAPQARAAERAASEAMEAVVAEAERQLREGPAPARDAGLFQVRLENNRIHGHAGAGVVVKNGARPALRSNRIARNGKSGVWFTTGASGLLEGSELRENGAAQVEVDDRSFPVVRNNRILAGRMHGVLCWHRAVGVVEGNDVQSSAMNGLLVKSHARTLFRGNKVHGSRQAGVRCCTGAEPCLTDNDVFGNQGPGVAVYSAADPYVIGNKLTENGGAGVFVAQGGRGLFADNQFDQNGCTAVFMERRGPARPGEGCCGGGRAEGGGGLHAGVVVDRSGPVPACPVLRANEFRNQEAEILCA